MRLNLTKPDNKNLDTFRREYLGEFEPSDREKILYQFALDYENLCESFDQLVCQYKNKRGIAMPVTSDERESVNKNAKLVFYSTILKVNAKLLILNEEKFTPVTPTEFLSFIHLAQRYVK